MAGFDGEGRAVNAGKLVTDFTGSDALYLAGQLALQTKHRTDAMGGVVHGRHTFPIAGPTVHILLVTCLQELNATQVAPVVHFLHKQILAAVNHGFHHHVNLATGFGGFHDALTILYAGGHRNRTGHVLARFQGHDAVLGVIANRGVDVHRVHIGVGQHVFIGGVASAGGHIELVRQLVEARFIALAQGHDFGIRVRLINGDELGTKAQSDQSYFQLAHNHSPV